VWDVSTGRTAVTFSQFGTFRLYDALHSSFSPDSRRLVVSSVDTMAQVFELATGEPVGPPLRHANWVWQAVFSNDGKHVITASSDNSARVWEVASGKPLTPPLRHRDVVFDAVFSPDGRFVATGSADGTARVWDAATGLPISPALTHPTFFVNRVRFSPDGKRLLTEIGQRRSERIFGYGPTPRGVWVWDLSADERPAGEAGLLAEWLAGRRLDATGSYVPLNWLDALDHWNVLIATQPGQWPLHYRRGRVHSDKRRWEEAAADYTRAIELGARDGEVYFYRSKALGERKLWADAAADATRALEAGYEEMSAWAHRAVCNRWLGRYDRAVADYTQVVERHPTFWGGWAGRASSYAALGEWERAEADFVKAQELGTHALFESQHAVLRLAVKDVPGYRKMIAALLERGGPSPDADTALWTAWTGVLIPDSGADPTRVVQLADRAVAVAPENRDSLIIKGAALYRAGKWEAAVETLTAAASAPPGAKTMAQSSARFSPEAFDDTGYELLFLAMAHHQLGHADEARSWLDRAVRWMEQAPLPKTDNGGDNPLYAWNRRVAHEVLRREAEALLKQAKP
jgi:tetratricopeptide (TPR) repeat protein